MNWKTYKEAQNWITAKTREYGSKGAFLASDEYRTAYPIIAKLADSAMAEYTNEADEAMSEAGVNYGDTVTYTHIGAFMTTTVYTGTVSKRRGIPYVKLNGQVTMNGKKSTRWHKGWTVA